MPESEMQQAIAPLVRAMDKMEERLARIEERINQLPSMYIPRTEYVSTNDAIDKNIDRLDRDIDNLIKRIERREEAARAHNISIILAIGGAIISIVLQFLK